jgi:hypothetical protein
MSNMAVGYDTNKYFTVIQYVYNSSSRPYADYNSLNTEITNGIANIANGALLPLYTKIKSGSVSDIKNSLTDNLLSNKLNSFWSNSNLSSDDKTLMAQYIYDNRAGRVTGDGSNTSDWNTVNTMIEE